MAITSHVLGPCGCQELSSSTLLTLVKLRAIVDRGVPPLGQHQGQVASDCQDEGQGGTDPERACEEVIV